MTTVEQDIQAAFNKFISLDNEGHQIDILCESMTERDGVLEKMMEAIKAGDRGLIGQIIVDATADYAHDCSTGGTL